MDEVRNRREPEARVKQRSYAALGLSMAAMGFSWWWLGARMFVCWGHDADSCLARFACHGTHWVTIALIGLQIVLGFHLALEFARLGRVVEALEAAHGNADPATGRRGFAAARHGYRRATDRHDRIVALVAFALWLVGFGLIVGFTLSPFRL